MSERVTVAGLQRLKLERRKIAGVVAWDAATARVLDGAGVDIVSVGDSVAVSLWGRAEEGDLTIDELLLVCTAVSRGVDSALVSCDLPDGSLDSAERVVAEGGAGMVKVAGEVQVAAIAAAGIAVLASLSGDGDPVEEARRLEAAGAAMLDFRDSGEENGRRVVEAVAIPVIGGLGGGPWLDGRMRAAHRLLAGEVGRYVDDVRAGRPVRGD